jgi:FAD-linked sulfhydryl oxidase
MCNICEDFTNALVCTNCPLNKKELGNSTWAFLHTVSVNYPNSPTELQKKEALNLLKSTSELYPCRPCGNHMKQELIKDSPKVNNAKEFADYLCKFHNKVNKQTGKELFDCSKIFGRWKK